MKKILVFATFTFYLISMVSAQQPSTESIRKRLKIGFGVNNDIWMKVPDSVNNRFVNQGVDVFVHYMFPMDRSGRISFFAGAGLGIHNFYSKSVLGYNTNNVAYFYNLPSKINDKKIEVTKSKISITYFDIPFGFQYKAANKMHATLGFKVGWNLNAHTKYKGSDMEGTGFDVKQKEMRLRNVQNMHYGPFATVGYKWWGISAFYQLTPIFEKEKGPEIFPLTIGVVFKPF